MRSTAAMIDINNYRRLRPDHKRGPSFLIEHHPLNPHVPSSVIARKAITVQRFFAASVRKANVDQTKQRDCRNFTE
jgi:hypothetical protein